MINPATYDEVLEDLEVLMRRMRRLGLSRTAGRVHAVLDEARAERYEAQPAGLPTVEFTIGPIREQRRV